MQWPWKTGAQLAELETRGFLYATDGRDILMNDPDGWEVGAPQLWWNGPAGGDGTGGPWGNPPPGADGHGPIMPAVTRCTNLIAATLAGLPWQVVQGRTHLSTPGWILDPQLLRFDQRIPAPPIIAERARLSAVDFWTGWITSALWLGDGYVYCPVRDASGAPQQPLALLHPSKVGIDHGRYFIRAGQRDIFGGDPLPEVEIPATDLIHLRGNPPYRGGHGTGVIDSAGPELGLAVAIRGWAQGQFTQGVPAGFLKVNAPKLTPDAAQKLREQWMTAHGSGRRSIAVLNATTDFTPIALSPLDAQLAQARQGSLADVAMAFGVPQWFLGIPGDSSTYANVESRFIELRTYTLLPWMRRVESTMDAQLPAGTSLKIATAGLERGDTTTRFAAYQTALAGGWMTVDEVRTLEDLPELPDDAAAPEPQLTEERRVSWLKERAV